MAEAPSDPQFEDFCRYLKAGTPKGVRVVVLYADDITERAHVAGNVMPDHIQPFILHFGYGEATSAPRQIKNDA